MFFLALSMSASGMSAASVDGHPSGGSVGKAAMALNTQKLPEDVYGSGLYAYSSLIICRRWVCTTSL